MFKILQNNDSWCKCGYRRGSARVPLWLCFKTNENTWTETIGFLCFLAHRTPYPSLIRYCLNLSASPKIPQLLFCLTFIGLKHITSNDRQFNWPIIYAETIYHAILLRKLQQCMTQVSSFANYKNAFRDHFWFITELTNFLVGYQASCLRMATFQFLVGKS